MKFTNKGEIILGIVVLIAIYLVWFVSFYYQLGSYMYFIKVPVVFIVISISSLFVYFIIYSLKWSKRILIIIAIVCALIIWNLLNRAFQASGIIEDDGFWVLYYPVEKFSFLALLFIVLGIAAIQTLKWKETKLWKFTYLGVLLLSILSTVYQLIDKLMAL